MKLSIKERMKRNNINSRPIFLVLIGLGFLSVILAATILASAQNLQYQSGNADQQLDQSQITPAASDNNMILAVVEKLDTVNNQITLFDVNSKEMLPLTYTGGTDITDKYGQVISIDQISVGIMVDASYQEDYKLTKMNISTRAWEYSNVNNFTFNNTDQIMRIASTKYKYTSDISVFDQDQLVSVNDLAEQDVLTVWGDSETIWSIIVTQGHGIVKLKDYDNYLGDGITIGYESMLPITKDFEVKVREGTFNLTVENGRYSATKSVTVERDKVTYVSLGDLGPVGLKTGKVTFDVTPFGADLVVDGQLISYSDPIELSYGSHAVEASLGGYTTYDGTVYVDSKSKTVKINLPEANSKNSVSVTESNNSNNTGTSTGSQTSEPSTSNDNTTSNTGTNTGTTTDNTKYSSNNEKYTLHDGDTVDKDHSIYIKAPDGASVYLDGDYMGTAPCKFDKIIGSHVLTFIKEGYETMSYTVEVSDDKVDAYFTFPALTKSK